MENTYEKFRREKFGKKHFKKQSMSFYVFEWTIPLLFKPLQMVVFKQELKDVVGRASSEKYLNVNLKLFLSFDSILLIEGQKQSFLCQTYDVYKQLANKHGKI